ncbi:MAG: UDP-glucose--hexose-1-phosphate uridylyltransferase [Lachnospiraceae bacterium]|nr:UDP-glucose--hexose-1-phosphate uridylyltransferase [Lachnospiraceae bacterium]
MERNIVKFARKSGAEKVILFGSRAKGTNSPRSDIDLAVLGGDFDAFYWMIQDQEFTLLMFDVINLNEKVSDELLKEIEQNGVVLYEKRGEEPMLSDNIDALVQYGINTGLTPECERIYTRNLLLEMFHEKDYRETKEEMSHPVENGKKCSLERILNELLDEAVRRNLIPDSVTYRDLFDTKLMNCLMPRPAEVQRVFREKYAVSPQEATEYFYKLSQDSNYIRRYRIRKDERWTVESDYGTIDITINLSKPEKDPLAIAAAKNAKQTAYPKCQLCIENEGYAGRVDHPARENHRVIPLTLCGADWGFQYSPYVYYNEHCIVFNQKHIPMKIDEGAFTRLFDFVRQFPHYFIGSNADLPIVGGSILSHDHFQGGHYTFAMAKAPIEIPVAFPGYEDVEAGIVHWPLSVIRIRHKDSARLVQLATHILAKWRAYTDEDAFIYAETDGVPHNTITPIARRNGDVYELDLTLRNNITTEEHPLGVYHPHAELHHIKKENIGLIEVMGLAVLPARLKKEMEIMKDAILYGRDWHEIPEIAAHAEWLDEISGRFDEVFGVYADAEEEIPEVMEESLSAESPEEAVLAILKEEVGKVFVRVLEDAGVYKCTEEGRRAFLRFVEACG